MKNLYEKFKPVFIAVIAVLAALALLLFAYLNWGFFTSGMFKYSKNILELKPFGSMDVFDSGNVGYYEVVNDDYIKLENGNQIRIKTGEFIKLGNGDYIKIEDGCCIKNQNNNYVKIKTGKYIMLENGDFTEDKNGDYFKTEGDEYIKDLNYTKYMRAQYFVLLGNGSWTPYEHKMFINNGLYIFKLHDNAEKLVSRNGDSFVDKWVCDVCGGVNAADSKECKKHLFCPDCNIMYTDNFNLNCVRTIGACDNCIKAKVLVGKWKVENEDNNYFEFMYDDTCKFKTGSDEKGNAVYSDGTWALSDGVLTITYSVKEDETKTEQLTYNINVIGENTIEIPGIISEQEKTTLKLVSRK